MFRTTAAAIVAIGLLVPGAHAHAPTVYTIDGSHSTLEIDVYKEGFFKMFGHDHLIAAREMSGRVLLDQDDLAGSSVAFRVATESMAVMDPGASEKDRAQVQTTMQSDKVLDVAHYPQILFTSTGVTKVARNGSDWQLTVAGNLEIHGTTRTTSVPLALSVQGDTLTATGTATVKQTDFGITPVTVAGGSVKVKDQLRIRFAIHATAATSR